MHHRFIASSVLRALRPRSSCRAALSCALAASAALGLADCMPPPAPVSATIAVPTLRMHDQSEMTRDGLTVSVSPITYDNYRRFPQAHRQVSWTRTVSQGSSVTSVPGTVDVNVIPLPSFQVRIANHTGHVVRLTQSVFRLQDNLGRTYPLMTGTSELLAWDESLWGAVGARAPDILPQVLPQVRAAVGQVQLLGRSTELLNGDEWAGYMVFNVNVSSEREYLELMSSVNRFTLRLAEIPVEVNEAGVPTRTTEFDYALDLAQASMHVTCPAGTTTPSLDTCMN